MENKTEKRLIFAATDQSLESNIVLPTEIKAKGKDMVSWGDRNNYPDYLLSLYNNVTSLRSIINGTIDFVVGDGATIAHTLQGDAMNDKGDTIIDLIKSLAKDYLIYGGMALQVVRGEDLETISALYYVDMRYLRSNKENDVFYYSEEFGQKYVKTDKVVAYPKFIPGAQHPASIIFVKNVNTQVYPAPLYAASVKACEIERNIDDYHLNSIHNGFSGSYIINFNNGVPSDAIKEEIERDVNTKFAGAQNAGRIVLSFNDSKDSQTTIQKAELQDFGEKYQALAKHSRQQIFTAFRATPNLFGIPTETTGFSEQEFKESFRLYNRTMVKPIQVLIADMFEKALGEKGVLSITPFTLDGAGEDNVR